MSRRIVKCNERYNLYVEDCNGNPITFRVWKDIPTIEVKIDKHFASANGYSSIISMFEEAEGGKEILERLGHIPKWISLTEDGDYIIEELPKASLN